MRIFYRNHRALVMKRLPTPFLFLGFAESMFTRAPDASKVALVCLVRQLQAWGFRLMDCQQSSPHISALGAESIPRRNFLDHLGAALTIPD